MFATFAPALTIALGGYSSISNIDPIYIVRTTDNLKHFAIERAGSGSTKKRRCSV